MTLQKWIRRKLCGHNHPSDIGILPTGFQPLTDYTVIRRENIGVCLGWGMRAEVLFRSLCLCKRCGSEFWTQPGYLPRENKVWRDDNNWPLNPDGTQMDQAE